MIKATEEMYKATHVNGKVVADVGCNKGYGAKILSRFAHKVVGIDVDIENIMVARGEKSGKNIEYRCENVLETEYAAEYDTVVCYEVLEHIEPKDTGKFLQKLNSMLKEDGILYISAPNMLVYDCYADTKGHINEMSYVRLLVNLRDAGFKTIKMFGVLSHSRTELRLLGFFKLQARIDGETNNLTPFKKLLRKCIRLPFKLKPNRGVINERPELSSIALCVCKKVR